MRITAKTLVLGLVCLTLCATSGAGQTRHPGIDLYYADKYAEAVVSLNEASKQKAFEADPDIWSYLGLSYLGLHDNKNAKKSLERAVKLAPAIATHHAQLSYIYLADHQSGKARSEATNALDLDPKNALAYFVRGSASMLEFKLDDADKDANQAIVSNPAFSQGFVLKSRVLFARFGKNVAAGSKTSSEVSLLKNASEVLKAGLATAGPGAARTELESELESAEAFYEHFSKAPFIPGTDPAPPEPGVTPLKITSKPRASYTDKARGSGVQGTIRAAVEFAANGKVKNVIIVKGLGSGLDQNVISATKNIVFEPKKINGKPVTVVRTIEYSFAIR